MNPHTRTLGSAARAFAPFFAAALLAWSVVLVGSPIDLDQYLVSALLATGGSALAVLSVWRHPRLDLGVAPGALLFLAAVGLLRNSVGGSTASGASALAMIPVFHSALHSRSRRDLAIVVAGVGAFYLAPILLVGPPQYPQTQYRTALLSVTVSSIIGFATQQLVASVRRQARQARHRERMLEGLSDVVHRLFDSLEPRTDVCRAARSISEATVALLYEPGPGADGLSCTALIGVDAEIAGTHALPRSAAHRALATGRPLLCSQDIAARLGSVDLWIGAGRPDTVLFQPLVRQGTALGVLVVGWPEVVAAGDPRTTVAALLAHEAAAVIARADAMHTLADEAHTDALTGLPNRRVWDAELEQALAGPGAVAIAMLDLDHFKQFNDTYGHPAGDRLLKETTAAWRDQLRAGDLLARLGGEEFGLLLRDTDAGTAIEVTERLRRGVSQGRTCSAGVTVAAAGQRPEDVIARADEALYQAKHRGRDRTQLSIAG